MRYGLAASNPAEWLAFKVVDLPLPILDALVGPIQARALMAAQTAGVFRKLGRGPATAAKLADDLALDAECVRLLLRVLRGMGYVTLDAGTWSLSSAATRWFGEQAKESYAAFLDYGPPQWKMIERLDEVLASGVGIDFHDTQTTEDWKTYQAAMFENGRASAWFVVENMPIAPGAKDLLDIAGAHGYLGAALARKHPGLRSTVLDRAEALVTARTIAKDNGYDDLVTFEEGDLRKDSFGERRDAVLLSNILHHFPATENLDILKRVKASMKPGATVGIFEIETPHDDATPDAAGDAFALYFRITSTSTCFRADDYVGWLQAAGFSEVKVVRSLRMPTRMLVIGRA